MAVLTVQQITEAGVEPTFAAPGASGDFFVLSATTFLVVKNASGAPITVTKKSYATAGPGLAVANQVVTVPDDHEAWIAFAMEGFRNVADGRAKATCSATTDVLVAAIRA